jgi:radical SAM protein with 4Fe4S-binding SPASM domain
MTVMEQTELCKQVKWLLNNNEFPFSSVHWQLNAGFWANDFSRRNFKQWSEEGYNHEVRKLVRFWVDQMEKNNTVLRLYPFLGIAQSLLSPAQTSLLRCGAGWINYAVQTDGHIVPCPTMWGMKNYYLGHISNTDLSRLKRVFLSEPCTKCDVFKVCGGRCLYANITKRWNTEAYSLVCETVRNLIDAIAKELPRIREFIENGKISLKDFEFMKYNGCEIIP